MDGALNEPGSSGGERWSERIEIHEKNRDVCMEAGKCILVVEDNPSDEFLTLQAFQDIGMKEMVAAVRDGGEALDYLFCTGSHTHRAVNDLPTLILLDLSLPSLNGIEVLDRIRADPRTRLIPVVIFTGSDSRRDLVASYVSGANSFVQKPVDFADYAEVLRQVWRYWSTINTSPMVPQPEINS
jgi:two-component system, response regulator